MSYKSFPRYKKYKFYSSDIWGNFFKRFKSFKGLDVFYARLNKKKTLRVIEVNPNKLRKRPTSLTGKYFKLKQKAKLFFFNFKEYQFRKIIGYTVKKKRTSLKTLESYFSDVFESRLDTILLRTNLFPSVFYIKNFIKQGGVFVNGVVKKLPHYQCKMGDKVTFSSIYFSLFKWKQKLRLRHFRKSTFKFKKILFPSLSHPLSNSSYLLFKPKNFSFLFLGEGKTKFFFQGDWSRISSYYKMLK